MIHAFTYLGVPGSVLTDNMKSVVIGRDPEGHPIWQK
ncbi:MAG: IS21 family transposase, partial [Lachnospiraceae bacterium]|nr:IS21 family transposase [Lachnospiraceae bacterium]